MDHRIFVLAIPSAIILVALVWHSVQAMPRRRAIVFWLSVAAYGLIRGLGVRAITTRIGASFPYEIHHPLVSIAGVSAQEIAGWAVVSYLAWWIGYRFSTRASRPYLFLQIAWASLFLGAVSWAIEAAAIAARWWHWTVPTASRIFLNVPAIGIVDWFFVGLDFLLPFAAMTAPSLANRRLRYLTLLFFPIHFLGHLVPAPWLHVVHWGLVLIAFWLALCSRILDTPFSETRSWVPTVAAALMITDIIAVELFMVRRPALVQSAAPAVAIWITAIRPRSAAVFAAAALLAALRFPSLLVTTFVVAFGTMVLWLRRQKQPYLAAGAVALLASAALLFHLQMLQRRRDMTRRLDQAIALRNRGELRGAADALEAIARDHPTSHVSFALAGEIYYRTSRFDAAHQSLTRAVEIKQDLVRAYRLLAAIDLQQGRPGEAARWASLGLEVAPADPQLRYLLNRGRGETFSLADIDSPEMAMGMAALAFEVGDSITARSIVEDALKRWPGHPALMSTRARLEAAGNP